MMKVAQDLVVDDVVPCFANRAWQIREAAYKVAAGIKPNNEMALALIPRTQEEGEWTNKVLIIEALAHHGKGNEQVKTTLSDLMYKEGETDEVHLAAAIAFAQVGGPIPQAANEVVLYIDSQGYQVAEKAMRALGEFGPRASRTAKTLVALASNEKMRTDRRQLALYSVGQMRKAAQYVSPDVVALLLSSSAEVLFATMSALKEIGVNKEALPALIKALEYRDPSKGIVLNRHPGLIFLPGLDMHELVANLLGSLGQDASDAIPALKELLTRATTESEAWKKLPPFELKKHRGPRSYLQKENERKLIDERQKLVRITSPDAKMAAHRALELIEGTTGVVEKPKKK